MSWTSTFAGGSYRIRLTPADLKKQVDVIKDFLTLAFGGTGE